MNDATIVSYYLMAITIHTMIPNHLNFSKFAEYIETIKMLYQIDDDFKSLCDDYMISKSSFEKFREKLEEEKEIEKAYKRLSVDLEKEILEYVQKRK
jgi:hypothetical protein